MNTDIFHTDPYRNIMTEHIYKTIGYLFESSHDFAIACEVKYIDFSPMLPDNILEGFNETVMFIISGYTFESANIDKQYFTFEAGFGEENFGSHIQVPLLAIKQVFINDYPILINHSEHSESMHAAVDVETEGTKNSMKSLLNNPENKKLLKRKK